MSKKRSSILNGFVLADIVIFVVIVVLLCLLVINNRQTSLGEFSPHQYSCIDSDGGADFYTAGTVTLIFGDTPMGTWKDICLKNSLGKPTITLKEYICKTIDNTRKDYDTVLYNCSNGCSNGACLKETGTITNTTDDSTTTTKPNQPVTPANQSQWYTCEDTDAMNDKNIFGEVKIFLQQGGKGGALKLVTSQPDFCDANWPLRPGVVQQFTCMSKEDYTDKPETLVKNLAGLKCNANQECTGGYCRIITTPLPSVLKKSCDGTSHGSVRLKLPQYGFPACEKQKYVTGGTRRVIGGIRQAPCWVVCEDGTWRKPTWGEILFGI